MIISFTLPPTPHSISQSGVDVSGDEDLFMNDDLEAENATITTPGEFITSARTFMRSSSCDPVSLRMTISRGHGTTRITMRLSHPLLAPLKGSISSSLYERCIRGTPSSSLKLIYLYDPTFHVDTTRKLATL